LKGGELRGFAGELMKNSLYASPSGVERRRTRGFCRRIDEKLSIYSSSYLSFSFSLACKVRKTRKTFFYLK